MNQSTRFIQLPFWLLTLSVVFALTLPKLIQEGMFMDAMLYTSVSHNLSLGIGSFWFPQFSVHNVAGMASFHEQPPLIFGIQSLFFSVLGDSLYVERIYTFLMLILTIWLIVSLWKLINRNNTRKSLAWLPVLLWIIIPVCFWSYSNNMHENTLGVFTLAAAIFIYKAILKDRFTMLWLILSVFFVFLATLSKGLPGLFPLAIPFIYWATQGKIKFKTILVDTIIITSIPVLAYIILLQFPDSKESLKLYFIDRAMHRINDVPTVGNRFYILGKIFLELLPPLILCLIFIAIARIKKLKSIDLNQVKLGLFPIFIGFAASVPLMLTLVQKSFYFVPALPFFALGLAQFISPIVENFVLKISTNSKAFKVFKSLTLASLTCVLIITMVQIGNRSRDKSLLHDIHLFGKEVPKFSTVSIPKEMWDNWSLQCYSMRYYNVSYDVSESQNYYLIDKSLKSKAPQDFEKVELGLQQFDLYKRN